MTPLLRKKIIVNPLRVQALVMIGAGFSYKYAARETQLSVGTIKYWAGQANIKTTNYRDGKTNVAKKFAEDIKLASFSIPEQKLIEYLAPAKRNLRKY